MSEYLRSPLPAHARKITGRRFYLPKIKTSEAGRGLLPWQTARVEGYVRGELSSRISIPDLARLVGLSSSYFSRAFKRSLGISPHAYVMHQRIEYAKQIMLTSTWSLSDIASLCGFSDQANFSNVFRRFVGTSPGWWRRNCRHVTQGAGCVDRTPGGKDRRVTDSSQMRPPQEHALFAPYSDHFRGLDSRLIDDLPSLVTFNSTSAESVHPVH